jgi:uracil-DNA glycosylase
VSQLPLTGEETSGAEALIPQRPTLKTLREAAAACTACPLHETGTQTVFGEGLKRARLMLIGEQPGDREDIEGHPFVGPAGRVLDQALERAGIERADAYVTNVVKHFKWKPKGKRRIHQTPRAEEIKACAPWLEAELEVVEPRVMVCLGAPAMPTLHPSAILRAEPEDRDEAMAMLVGDLTRARDHLAD